MNEEELCAVATTIVVLVEDIRLRATACSLVVVALHESAFP